MRTRRAGMRHRRLAGAERRTRARFRYRSLWSEGSRGSGQERHQNEFLHNPPTLSETTFPRPRNFAEIRSHHCRRVKWMQYPPARWTVSPAKISTPGSGSSSPRTSARATSRPRRRFPRRRARGQLLAKSECVVSGLPVARRVFELLDPSLSWVAEAPAGSRAPAGTSLARLSGRARPILTAERVALNLLQRMCGIATETRRYVDARRRDALPRSSTRARPRPGLRRVRPPGRARRRRHEPPLRSSPPWSSSRTTTGGSPAASPERSPRRAPAPRESTIEVEVESGGGARRGPRRGRRPHPDRQPDAGDRGPLVRASRGRRAAAVPRSLRATCASTPSAPTREAGADASRSAR